MVAATLKFCCFKHPPTTEIYPLSLHDALPICIDRVDVARVTPPTGKRHLPRVRLQMGGAHGEHEPGLHADRKSTRLNSSHMSISYAVFCLKKKKIKKT